MEENHKTAIQKIVEVLEARARSSFPEDIERAIGERNLRGRET